MLRIPGRETVIIGGLGLGLGTQSLLALKEQVQGLGLIIPIGNTQPLKVA